MPASEWKRAAQLLGVTRRPADELLGDGNDHGSMSVRDLAAALDEARAEGMKEEQERVCAISAQRRQRHSIQASEVAQETEERRIVGARMSECAAILKAFKDGRSAAQAIDEAHGDRDAAISRARREVVLLARRLVMQTQGVFGVNGAAEGVVLALAQEVGVDLLAAIRAPDGERECIHPSADGNEHGRYICGVCGADRGPVGTCLCHETTVGKDCPVHEAKPEPCSTCGGAERVSSRCPGCDGSGLFGAQRCSVCSGCGSVDHRCPACSEVTRG